MASTNAFAGKWLVPDVPPEFEEILKILGYNKIERKVFKSSKVYLYSDIKDNVLTVKMDSSVFKKVRSYPLNNDPVIYKDEKKREVIEICGWTDESTIEIKTMIPEEAITVIDTRKLISPTECQHTILLLQGVNAPVKAEVIYKLIN